MVPGPNRGQEVRVNGPIGGPSQMRMDVGFPGQSGQGIRKTICYEMLGIFSIKLNVTIFQLTVFFIIYRCENG